MQKISNELAYKVLRQLSENGTVPCSPIFLYGAAGVGKTHLLSACCQEMKERFPNKKILAVSAEELSRELLRAIRTGGEARISYREKYRALDALFVDDLQVLAGKEQTQEEFCSLFHAIIQRGGQIVLASSSSLSATEALNEQFRTQFDSGVLVEIGQPETSIIEAYIEKKLRASELKLSQECRAYLARSLNPSIRSVDGALNRLAAKHVLTGKRMTTETIKEELRYYLKKEEEITPEEILSYVATWYNCHIEDLIGWSRAGKIVKACMVAINLLREVLNMDLLSIGKIFDRDHASIFCSLERFQKMRYMDADLNQEIEGLKQNLEGRKSN